MLAVGALTSVVAAVGMGTGAASAATGSVPEVFYADSGDACAYGTTSGVLTWYNISAVDVSGVLVDRPTGAPSGSTQCGDDKYDSTVRFTLYDGSTLVDSAQRTVDNGATTFDFTLGLKNKPLDPTVVSNARLVIRVCRDSTLPMPLSYCGKKQTYTPPAVVSPGA